MKRLLFALIVLLSCRPVSAQETIPVIPMPAIYHMTGGDPYYFIPTGNIVVSDDSLRGVAGLLDGYQFDITHRHLSVTKGSDGPILLEIDTTVARFEEGYRLTIRKEKILIRGHDAAGLLHGVSTLRQLWEPRAGKGLCVPAYDILDHPRFPYRGMHLDVGRHFFPVSFIKEYIDWLSLYKFNNFHWHLTEDQGWRIEIKKYPLLQSVAAYRDETLIGHKRELPHKYDGKKYGGYYTQAEIREVIAYATARYINVIPEIEMPGHALAALSAYPNLGCTGGPYRSATFWGVFEDVFCAGNDSVFTFLQDVLDEVIDLFPSRQIHIGGDECPKTKWAVCPKCRRRMREEGLADEHALQSWFIRRIEKYLTGKGRQIIGWDEILEGGLAPGATVMSWRGEQGAIAAAEQHHPVILSPESHFYFDYYQSLSPAEPVAAGGYTPVDKVFCYDPLSTIADTARRRELMSYVRGVQGQVWTEYMTTPAAVEYMLFPRVAALAEQGWYHFPDAVQHEGYYNGFLRRLRVHRKLWNRLHLRYADNFDEIRARTLTKRGRVLLSLASQMPGADLRYTTDGRLPTSVSRMYATAIELRKNRTVKARLFVKTQPITGQRVFTESFVMHKAVGAELSYRPAPVQRFDPGGQTLVNGVTGNRLYNDSQWIGWNAPTVEIVTDLGSVMDVRRIGMNILNYHWQRMWPPATLQFFFSEDGVQYHEVHSQSAFPVNGINRISKMLQSARTRFVKVVMISPGTIPAGEYGAGEPPLMLADELIIE